MFPEEIINGLSGCLQVSHNPQSLQDLSYANKDIFGYSFDELTLAEESFPRRIRVYIKGLCQLGTLPYFISIYCNNFNNNAAVDSFFKRYKEVFRELHNGRAQIKSEFQDCITVNSNNAIFINRDNVKKAIYEMVNLSGSKTLFINGQKESGFSYIKWFLIEYISKIPEVEFYEIDIKKIYNLFVSDSKQLHAAHIAYKISQELVLNCNLNIENVEDFKFSTETFKGAFQKYMKESDRKYIFFVHQFMDEMSSTVHELLSDICDFFISKKIDSYIIFSGYDQNKIREDLKPMLNLTKNTVQIDYFNDKEIEVFIKKIYLYLETLKTPNVSLDELWAKIKTNVLTNQNMLTPNVKTIGPIISNWYSNVCQKNL